MANDSQFQSEYESWAHIQQQQKKRVWQADTLDTAERKQLLKLLRKVLIDHEAEWLEALQQDVGKSAVEAYTAEIAVLLHEIEFLERHLDKWQRPKRSYQLKLIATSQTSLVRKPYGSILIISPWNYPLHLAFLPAIGAIAAGNSCFIKPSEFAPATGKLMAELIAKYFSPEVLTVVQGDETVAQELLTLPWDFIFFTGSKKVGAFVHQAAAEKQIPVVLELGGKNPCIVDETNVSKETVKRIIWGKFLNAGQTCIAPDTVYVQKSVYPEFLDLAITIIKEFYGENPQENLSYGRLIHEKQFHKMTDFLQEGTIQYGGKVDEKTLFVEPTLLTDFPEDSMLLTEEIFGPILPVVPYTEVTDLVKMLQQKESPLAMYLFSKHQQTIELVEQQLRSGSFNLNHVILQGVSSSRPFGGVGGSGFGRYHGLASLDTFSYQKTNLKSLFPIKSDKQYPPYQIKDLSLMRRFRKWLF